MDGLRIVSDGTTEGTYIYLDGEEVHDVTAVTWHFSPKHRKTTVTLEISNVTMDTIHSVPQENREQLAATMLDLARHATPPDRHQPL